MKDVKAEPVTEPSFMFPARLTLVRWSQSPSIFVSFLRVSSVIVIADEFATAIDDPPFLPRAPRDNVRSSVMPVTVLITSALDIAVEVSESFSREEFPMRVAGRWIFVNETSRRRTPGQTSRIVFSTWSPTGVSLSFRVRKLGNWKLKSS